MHGRASAGVGGEGGGHGMRSLARVDERRGKDRARGWALRAAYEGMEQA